MPRHAHPKKEIEQALRYAEAQGWRVVAGGGHCWGKIYCPHNSDECRCGEFCVASLEHTQEPRHVGASDTTNRRQLRCSSSQH